MEGNVLKKGRIWTTKANKGFYEHFWKHKATKWPYSNENFPVFNGYAPSATPRYEHCLTRGVFLVSNPLQYMVSGGYLFDGF